MSDYDDYFDSIDEEALAQLRELEAHHTATSPSRNAAVASSSKKAASSEDDSDLFEFSLNNDELAELEEAAVRQQNSPSKASTSNGLSTSIPTSRQMNLHGERVMDQPAPKQPQQRPAFGQKLRKTKVWDCTAFAKTGWKNTKPQKNVKGKAKAVEDPDEEEYVDVEGLVTPFMPLIPMDTMNLQPDELTMKDWIFPLNNPKRDYQYNIVKLSLFDNCLVAIPTGLGKTFIAGCVMLNFYRWFPDGKIVFVAPTKPLVAQQIEACHQSCGIPGTDAIELTGQIPRDVRSAYWKTKRVFYMTPQTLVNDLATGNCDPSSIVLLVVDEAHKGTGDYAYAQIVRFMMSTNPFFRILALTATPGSTPEVVQRIVDSLHISHIEIRNEGSMDVQPYLHKKVTNRNVIPIEGDIVKIQQHLARLMDKYLKPLRAAGVLYYQDPVKVKPYACSKKLSELQNNQKYLFGPLKNLASLSRIMAYLLEFSVQMAYNGLRDLGPGGTNAKNKKAEKETQTQSKIAQDPDYIACIQEIERQKAIKKTFPRHPKMERLRELAIQHFAGAELEEEEKAKPGTEPAMSTTKMIVFCTYRECVDEIVEMLDEQQPMIRAHKFIGQGTDKRGGKGVTQKQQIAVIRDFKEGKHNVLVSTSIGEEGLDIGEVDVIICYDTQKAAIKMVQRVGRTGRKKDGRVELLLTKDREEDNYSSAIDAYKTVQQSIVKGTELELYGDVKRLLPDHVRPQCIEMVMEIIPYEREERSKPGISSRQVSSKSKGNKSIKPARKRSRAEDDGGGSPSKRRKFIQSSSDDEEPIPKMSTGVPKRVISIPKSAPVGFQSARDLAVATESVLASQSTSHKAKSPKFQNDTLSRKSSSLSKSRATTTPLQPKPVAKNDMAWLMDSDSDTAPKTAVGKKQTLEDIIDLTESDEEDPDPRKPDDVHLSPRRGTSAAISPFKSGTKVLSTRVHSSPGSPPVQRIDHHLPPKTLSDDISDDFSSPVLRRLKRKEDIEDRARMPPPPLPGRAIAVSKSSVHPAARKRPGIKPSILDRPEYLEVEAIHSGDEVEAGSSDPEGEENSSDREFVVDTSATQVSSDYDQSAVYRQGLFTQARTGGPLFAAAPVRTGYLGRGRGLAVQGTRILPSSSPEKDEELDSYSLGSFVVDDDDDIMVETSNEL